MQCYFLAVKSDISRKIEKERQMMERAQKPNELWQSTRRFAQVLKRLWADVFSAVFQEAVDTNVFLDYCDIIDTLIDLGTVKSKLLSKKYQAPEVFAQDV